MNNGATFLIFYSIRGLRISDRKAMQMGLPWFRRVCSPVVRYGSKLPYLALFYFLSVVP